MSQTNRTSLTAAVLTTLRLLFMLADVVIVASLAAAGRTEAAVAVATLGFFGWIAS